MLTYKDKFRLNLKNFEFWLPLTFQKIAHIGLSNISPYLKKDDELKSIFIHIPKAAGTSLRKAVYGHGSFHVPAIRYKISDSERFNNYFKYAFVRNPWDRIHSAFNYLTKGTNNDSSFVAHRWVIENLLPIKNFEEFIYMLESPSFQRNILTWIHFRPQIDWISEPSINNKANKILVDYIGRFETLNDDYQFLINKLDLSGTNLPLYRNMPPIDSRLSYTNSKMVDIVDKIYANDIKQFGYKFE